MVAEKSQRQLAGNNYKFRQAVPEDIESLAELRWRLCTDDVLTVDPLGKNNFIEVFKSALPEIASCNNNVHFVAELNNIIIAVLSIVIITKIPSPNDINGQWGYLTNVYTLPEYRNKGIGSTLLSKARKWAEIQRLELLVVWPSDRSYVFYERVSFQRQQREQDPLVLIILNEM